MQHEFYAVGAPLKNGSGDPQTEKAYLNIGLAAYLVIRVGEARTKRVKRILLRPGLMFFLH